jgi:hypothetical protein
MTYIKTEHKEANFFLNYFYFTWIHTELRNSKWPYIKLSQLSRKYLINIYNRLCIIYVTLTVKTL